MKQKIPDKRFKQFERIAKLILYVDTLTVQHRDCLDFHDCSVWSITDALEMAYQLGQKEKV